MAEIVITMPEQLMEKAKILAEREGVSVNEFLIYVIAEKVGLLSKNIAQVTKKSPQKLFAQVDSISQNGIKVIVQDDEDINRKFFAPFSKYPQLLNATLEQIFDVEHYVVGYLSWPRLNFDLAIENLQNPGEQSSSTETRDS